MFQVVFKKLLDKVRQLLAIDTQQIGTSLPQTSRRFTNQITFKVVDEKSYEAFYEQRKIEFMQFVRFIPNTTPPHIVAVPAMPKQGTNCGNACTCMWEIHVLNFNAGDYDCYWIKGADDDCSTCVVRAERWAPFRIRKGEVVVE
jgi:hypothetical protein